MAELRTGQGFDVHAFADNRRLVLGGVEIEYKRGLAGHSDADVLLHAICDALLGAAGLGDIGHHFPDSDEAFRDADSSDLLKEVWRKVKAAGFTSIVNIDATVIAQQPKLADYIGSMCKRIASVLEIAIERVNVKATTTEHLGFTGREEGIAATAVCLIEKK